LLILQQRVWTKFKFPSPRFIFLWLFCFVQGQLMFRLPLWTHGPFNLMPTPLFYKQFLCDFVQGQLMFRLPLWTQGPFDFMHPPFLQTVICDFVRFIWSHYPLPFLYGDVHYRESPRGGLCDEENAC
jgi:hypothetical protein